MNAIEVDSFERVAQTTCDEFDPQIESAVIQDQPSVRDTPTPSDFDIFSNYCSGIRLPHSGARSSVEAP